MLSELRLCGEEKLIHIKLLIGTDDESCFIAAKRYLCQWENGLKLNEDISHYIMGSFQMFLQPPISTLSYQIF